MGLISRVSSRTYRSKLSLSFLDQPCHQNLTQLQSPPSALEQSAAKLHQLHHSLQKSDHSVFHQRKSVTIFVKQLKNGKVLKLLLSSPFKTVKQQSQLCQLLLL